jgi:small conductance mechanosensitive channel
VGVVEEVTLRYVRLRDVEGAVHYVPNGVIATVTNRSRDFAYAVIEFGVGYKENVDDIFELMRIVGREMREDPVAGEKILDDIEIFGVEKWADSAVNMRCRFKVRAGEQFGIRREYLRRLKNLFDAKGVEIPFPSRTVYTRNN